MEKPQVAQKFPCRVKLVAGRRYLWCACGMSRKQPFCDGAHAGSGFLPMFYTAKETEEVDLCACKQSGNKPFCDGSHAKLNATPGCAASEQRPERQPLEEPSCDTSLDTMAERSQ